MYTPVRAAITMRSGRTVHGSVLVREGNTFYGTLRSGDDHILLRSTRGVERIEKTELKEVRIISAGRKARCGP